MKIKQLTLLTLSTMLLYSWSVLGSARMESRDKKLIRSLGKELDKKLTKKEADYLKKYRGKNDINLNKAVVKYQKYAAKYLPGDLIDEIQQAMKKEIKAPIKRPRQRGRTPEPRKDIPVPIEVPVVEEEGEEEIAFETREMLKKEYAAEVRDLSDEKKNEYITKKIKSLELAIADADKNYQSMQTKDYRIGKEKVKTDAEEIAEKYFVGDSEEAQERRRKYVERNIRAYDEEKGVLQGYKNVITLQNQLRAWKDVRGID